MFNLRKFSYRTFDWVLLASVLLLVVIGLSAVYSVDLSRGEQLVYFRKQLIAAGIGGVLLFFAAQVQSNFFRASAKLAYFISITMLVLVLIFGSTIRGTRGWFNFGGFSVQPAEVAKVGLILVLAYAVYHFGRRFERPLFFFGTLAISSPLILLIMIQPDFGSAVIIGLIWFGMMLLIKVRKIFVIGLLSLAICFSIFSWHFLLKPYQKDRILTFVQPEKDAWGSGYNSMQATIAIGAGGFFGRGLGFGSQSQLRFLPEAQTDFVFSVIAEELGLAGVIVMIVLYGTMLYRLLQIVKKSEDDFSSAVAGGIAILFFSQFVVNIGANIGLMPITGVTLPFVSYGGSSLIMNLFLVGIAESLVKEKY